MCVRVRDCVCICIYVDCAFVYVCTCAHTRMHMYVHTLVRLAQMYMLAVTIVKIHFEQNIHS